MKRIYLDNVNPKARIAVAMSGGVDSSVAACLMHQSGYEVVGITLQLYDQGEVAKRKKACCAGQDIYDAKCVADHMGFTHYVLDYESIFKQGVIDDFVDSYMKGETPIPCIKCNQKVKFEELLKTAQNLGCEALVTGHYVKRVCNNNSVELHQAKDLSKDQSYFLFATTSSQLEYLRFPLGEFDKTYTRQLAKEFGLSISGKPDSQDICFVPGGNYRHVVAQLRPEAMKPGEIVDLKGQKLGEHTGIINFTIGQRKGIGVSGKSPLYVIKLEPETSRVIVGPKEALKIKFLYIKDLNCLIKQECLHQPYECYVKVRSTKPPIRARVQIIDDGMACVELLDNEYGIACGQACVMFENTRVLGGGWIADVA